MTFHIGIDLGTTNSAMATYDEGSESAEMIENFEGDTTTPSVVQILEDEVVVGENAVNQAIRYPDKTFRRTKPDMGTDTEYEAGDETYRPEQIAAFILEKLQTDAQNNRGDEVDAAVITVPYYFGQRERKATEDAAEIAGLNALRVMNEPTAACYAYGVTSGEDQTLLVYDLGGGTFDATIVEVDDGVIEVKDTDGSMDLGGENFDDKLYEHIKEEIIEQGGDDPDDDSRVKFELREKVKDAKETLSGRSETVIAHRGDDFYEVEITAEEFQDLTQDLVDETIDIIDDLLENSGYSAEAIDNVLMVGGSTRMPHVQDAVEDRLGMEPSTDANPDEIVARGAALDAATFNPEIDIDIGGENSGLVPAKDILSHTLGVETETRDGPNTVDTILEKKTEVPEDNTKTYGNPTDSQTDLICHVIEGEEEKANHEDNTSLGDFVLQDVPADAEIEVNFFIRDDGTLDVEADVVGMDEGGQITIDEGIGLEEKELDDMQDEHEEKSAALGADD